MNRESEVPTRNDIHLFILEQMKKKRGIPDFVGDKVPPRATEAIEKADVKSSFPQLDDEAAEKIMQDLSSYEKVDRSYPLRYV